MHHSVDHRARGCVCRKGAGEFRRRSGDLAPRAGIGLRAPHYQDILRQRPDIAWLEVHSENYFGDGGQPLDYLQRIGAHYPLSLHGVGLSLGRADALEREHLRRLKRLVARFEPALVSEHLSWGAIDGKHVNDLLPLPYTEEALALVCSHIDEAQEFLGRHLLIENISSYLQYAHSTIDEWDFLAEVVERTGCGILLDVNNIYVAAHNHGFDAQRYLAAMPVDAVEEIHLAGHTRFGKLLVDTHGARVAAAVWALYRDALARFGTVPTLIEWDTDIPPLSVLLAEAATAGNELENTYARAA